MKIAQQLKSTNVAEYILYMFQLEDTLRAYDCDPDRIADEYVSRFDWSDEDKEKTAPYAGVHRNGAGFHPYKSCTREI